MDGGDEAEPDKQKEPTKSKPKYSYIQCLSKVVFKHKSNLNFLPDQVAEDNQKHRG